MLVNTLTSDDKYSLRNRKKLPQQIQMQLSEKQKISRNILLDIWNLNQILKLLEKKDDLHRLCVFEIRDCIRCG